MIDTSFCPICNLIRGVSAASDSMVWHFDCPRCGSYIITWAMAEAGFPQDIRPYLSAATRQASERGDPVTLSTDNINDLASSHQRTTIPEKLDKLLAFLASKANSPGHWSAVQDSLDYPVVDACDGSEFHEYCRHLVGKGLIVAGDQATRVPGKEEFRVTIDGWLHLAPTRNVGGEPGRCFVASWLDGSMDEPYRNGIDPAVRACGYTPVWMKDVPENNGITDRILSEIRRAEFIVADFTDQRQNVYFEAGFAQGLGREVISCCREDHADKLHFDRKHLGHIRWKDSTDLRAKLEHSIRANIITKA